MSREGLIDSPRTVFRSARAFLTGTLLSRMSGLGRDTAMAYAFGSDPAIAAFMVAFRFANLIRRLFGEGSLPASVIPHFEVLRAQSELEGARFFRDLFFSSTFLLAGIIGGLELILYGIGTWGGLNPENVEILTVTMWMLPGMLFICLFGVCSGILQCDRRYFLTGVAPVAFNVVWIGAVLLLKNRASFSVGPSLAVAVIVAFFMQWLMVMPRTLFFVRATLGWQEIFRPLLFSSQLRQIAKPFLLGTIGVAAVQINSALDAVFARYASLEGPAYLWYAIRVEQLPLALFGIALSAALLPPLARAMQEGASLHSLSLLRVALRRGFSLMLPCTFALGILGLSGTNLLYGHGSFTTEAIYQTLLCLWGYGLGLVPATFVLIFAALCYAAKEYRVPMIGALIAVGVNLLCSSLCVFVWHLGACSIAIATSLASWVNCIYLMVYVAKRHRQVEGVGVFPLFDRSCVLCFFKTTTCTLIAAGITLLTGSFLIGDLTLSFVMTGEALALPRQFLTQLMPFLTLSATFLLILFSYAWMIKAESILALLGISFVKPAAKLR